jgi:hypothetical protein
MPVVTSARGLVRRHRRPRPREVANARGCERKADQDEGAGHHPMHHLAASRDRDRQRQEVIQGEAEEKSGQEDQGRPRDDARGRRVGQVLLGRVHIYAPRQTAAAATIVRENANQGVIVQVDNHGVNWESRTIEGK